MCPTPKPITEFGKTVMNHIVNRQFDLVKEEIKRFKEGVYVIHYRAISCKEYKSFDFIELSRKIMQEAKKSSKGGAYHGILVFFPFINKKNYKSLFNPIKRSLFVQNWDILFRWSIHFNDGKCLNNAIINMTDASCDDANIYLMAFYFKGRH